MVVSYDEGTWIAVAVCPACDCDRLVSRLSNEWAGFLRNSPKMDLPQLRIEYCQTNSIGTDRDKIVEAYRALVDPADCPRQSGQTILVVDDDLEVSQCLGVRLQAAGFTVISAIDGEQGLSAALEHLPDAIVLDVKMPKKDGLTMLRELRTHPSMERTPVVMLSASIRDQHRALEAGASYFVSKPYEAIQVLSALESSLQQETLT